MALAGMLPLAIAEASAALAPATRGDFKRTVAPTLALVAPAGMSEGDMDSWQATAMETLRGIPTDLLERGCTAARRVVDHPSKIVPAIFREIGEAWDRRKRELGRLRDLQKVADDRPVPAVDDPYIRAAEASAIIDEFGLRSERGEVAARPPGPARVPDAAFYISQGMSPDEARRAVADVEAGMAAQARGVAVDAVRQIDRRREAGWRLIARALARRYTARRQRENVAGYNTTIAALVTKHGQPPLAWLIGETRMALEMRRDMAA